MGKNFVPFNQRSLGNLSPGRPLPHNVQQQMEATLNSDFSRVRVHTGNEAVLMNSQGFARGNDVYLPPGALTSGEHTDALANRMITLMAHEVSHVVQQGPGGQPGGGGRAPFVPAAMEPVISQIAEAGHSLPRTRTCTRATRRITGSRLHRIWLQPTRTRSCKAPGQTPSTGREIVWRSRRLARPYKNDPRLTIAPTRIRDEHDRGRMLNGVASKGRPPVLCRAGSFCVWLLQSEHRQFRLPCRRGCD